LETSPEEFTGEQGPIRDDGTAISTEIPSGNQNLAIGNPPYIDGFSIQTSI